MAKVDYSLMFVTDDSITKERVFLNILEAALKGGATIIQLREKYVDTHSFYERAVKCKLLCKKYAIPLIINDRVDISMAIDADGVHIGQTDMPYSIVRKLLGPTKIIGLSVSNTQQATEAESFDVDYIGVSPIFSTQTKRIDLDSPLGIEGLKKIRTLCSKPMVCIGGVGASNSQEIMENGADGVAVISAISKAQDPELETRKLKAMLCKTGLKK